MAALDDSMVTSAPLAPPAQEPVPTAPPAEPAEPPKPIELPDPVKKNPIVMDMLKGTIPGVLLRPGLYYPDAWKIAEHSEALMKVGLDFYPALDESFAMFNPASISEQELQTADRTGKLHQILPDYETLSGEKPVKPPPAIAKQMDEMRQRLYGQPALSPDQSVPAMAPPPALTPTPPPVPAAPPMVGPAALPAKSINKLTTARANALAPGGPSSGPFPGAGRLVNALAKPAI